MGIVHISAPGQLTRAAFGAPLVPPALGTAPQPALLTCEAYEAPDGSVSTGTWEASPRVFARAIADAEFCHFIAGHASFETADGARFEFRAGDAAYFPPNTRGTWTIHATLRKTYCIWR